jgi:hypothetical protein
MVVCNERESMNNFTNMMVNRRQALALGLSGAAALALAACGGSQGESGDKGGTVKRDSEIGGILIG